MSVIDGGGDAATGIYCLPADVRSTLVADGSNVPDQQATAASLDDATLLVAIGDATAEVEARLAGRYQVPLQSPIPPVVSNITASIAAYLATILYRQGAPLEQSDPVSLRYQRAQALLRDIANGVAVIDIGGTEPASTIPAAVNQTPYPLFPGFGPQTYGPGGVGYGGLGPGAVPWGWFNPNWLGYPGRPI